MLTIYLLTQLALILKTMKIRKSEIACLLAVFAVFVTASVWIQGGGLMLFGEADWFLIDHNTSERSFWNKILCPHQHDADAYLAREITHIVEHIDARFVHWCVSNGVVHFMSIMTYVFLCGIAAMVWFLMRRHGWPNWFSLLAIGVLLTAPPIILAGVYIRPGHAHATFWATVMLLLTWQRFEALGRWLPAAVFGSSLAMVWADRQGLFMAIACVLLYFAFGDQWIRKCAKLILASIVVHTFWMVAIGPRLIDYFTDFKVGANYQGEPVIKAIPILIDNGWNGFLIALNNVAMLFGNVSLGIAAVIVVAAALTWRSIAWTTDNSIPVMLVTRRWYLSAPVFIIALGAVMYGLILHRQAALIWPDLFSTAYYLIFGTVIVWLAAVWYVQMARFRFNGDRKVELLIACVMGACIVGNVSGIRGHVTTMKQGHLQGFIAGAPYLKAKLKQVADTPVGTSTNRYDVRASMHFTEFKHVMKNPLEYSGLTADAFAESSQYLQWFRSEKRLPFGKGGREQ